MLEKCDAALLPDTPFPCASQISTEDVRTVCRQSVNHLPTLAREIAHAALAGETRVHDVLGQLMR